MQSLARTYLEKIKKLLCNYIYPARSIRRKNPLSFDRRKKYSVVRQLATNATIIVIYPHQLLPVSKFARWGTGHPNFIFLLSFLARLFHPMLSWKQRSNEPWLLHHFYVRHISCWPNVPTNDALFRTQFGESQAGTSWNKCARNGPRASGRMSFLFRAIDRPTSLISLRVLSLERRLKLQNSLRDRSPSTSLKFHDEQFVFSMNESW